MRTARMWMISAVAATAGIAAIAPADARPRDRELIIEVNGRRVDLGSKHEAYLNRGVWMIPARPVLRAARVRSEWDSRRKELEIMIGYDAAIVTVDSYTVRYGRTRRETLSRVAAAHHGEPYLPADFLAKAVGSRADYDRRYHLMSFGSRRDRIDDRWGDRGGYMNERPRGRRPVVRFRGAMVRFGTERNAFFDGGVWMYPVDDMCRAAGRTYRYDRARKSYEIDGGGERWTGQVGERVVMRGRDDRRDFRAPVTERNSALYAPAEFFDQVLGRDAVKIEDAEAPEDDRDTKPRRDPLERVRP